MEKLLGQHQTAHSGTHPMQSALTSSLVLVVSITYICRFSLHPLLPLCLGAFAPQRRSDEPTKPISREAVSRRRSRSLSLSLSLRRSLRQACVCACCLLRWLRSAARLFHSYISLLRVQGIDQRFHVDRFHVGRYRFRFHMGRL